MPAGISGIAGPQAKYDKIAQEAWAADQRHIQE